jgi:hypothetical protein
LTTTCEAIRQHRPEALRDVVCLGVGAALRVDVGALLLGSGRGALLPLLVGTAALLLATARARLARVAADGQARTVDQGALDFASLAAFSFFLAAALALASERGLLGTAPSPVALLGLVAIALGSLAFLAPERQQSHATRTAPTSLPTGLGAAAGGLGIFAFVLAVRLTGAG